MRVVLLALSSRYIHLSPAPYYLAAELSGYDTCVLDHSVNEEKEAVLADILSHAPDVLGLSVYIWNLTYLNDLLPEIRKRMPSCHIVLGGPEVSHAQRETLLRFPFVTVLSGEGEVPFRLLCDAIAENREFDEIPAASYVQRDGSMKISEAFVGVGTPKSPLCAGYGEALKGRIAYIEASRGCPFRCAFCLSGRCGSVRFFDIEQVKADILLLAAKSKTIKFIDRTFNAEKKRANELFSFILAHYGKEIPKDTRFHFEIAGELLDEEAFALLKTAPRGAFQMEIGVQSMHEETLRAIHRPTNLARLKENIARLLSFDNIHVHIDLIAGLTGESFSSFRDSFDGAYRLAPHVLQCGFLKLLHGAPMRENPEEYPCEYESEPPYEVKSTPWLTNEELAKIHTAEAALDRLYNSRRYKRTLSLLSSSPFSMFFSLGERLRSLPPSAPLAQEIALVYSFLQEKGINEDSLHDAMLLDLMATNSSRLTPAPLRKEDARIKSVRRTLSLLYPEKKGVRRSVCLLSEDRCAFVDYTEKDALSKEYPLFILPIPTF